MFTSLSVWQIGHLDASVLCGCWQVLVPMVYWVVFLPHGLLHGAALSMVPAFLLRKHWNLREMRR